MKIAIFSYYYPSINRTYITSLCDMLVNTGNEVNVHSFFIQDPVDNFENQYNKILEKSDNIKNSIFKILRKKIKNFLSLYFFNYTKYFLQCYYVYIERNKQKKELHRIKKELLNYDNYDCSIGIEKGGLICAYQFYKIKKIPYFYFSLELYDENHPFVIKSTMLKILRQKEIKAHQKSIGTIIADEDRKNYLYEKGNINHNIAAFYMPISFNDKKYENKMSVYSNNHNKKIILNFGYNRLPDDFFVNLLKKMPIDYIFYMHHYDTSHHIKLSREYALDNFKYSNIFVDEKKVMEIINDSFIGVCWYQEGNANDILSAFSSEKTARYLAAGKPIIANEKTNFNKLFHLYKCGIAVNNPEEFIDAINKITYNYKEFSFQSRNAYEQIYKLSNYEQSLNIYMQNNIKDSTK